jgi:hypothetical protein
MIKVTHDGVTYRVSFKHYNRMSVFIGDQIKTRKGTKCMIDRTKEGLPASATFSGWAVCHSSDRFEKEIGRKRSLEDALRQVEDKEIRRALWEAYFAR